MAISEVSLWFKDSAVIELRNKDRKIVGAIYTSTVDPTKLILTATKNTDEKYYLYYEGFGIYFSFWQKNIV